MQKVKRFFAMLLSAVMICTSLPLTSFAAEASDSSINITVESRTVQAGQTVDIAVNIDKNPGIIGAAINVAYDEGLILKDVKNTGVFSYMNMNKPSSLTSPCRISWEGEDVTQVGAGAICILTFEVDSNCSDNAELFVKVTSAARDFTDSDLNNVSVNCKNGILSVANYVPGDVDGDGNVTVADIVSLRRYLAGYGNNILNEKAANVNNDQYISTADVVLLRRYLAGGYDVDLKYETSDYCKHTKQFFAETAASCTEDGNTAYYYCDTCEKYFSDSEGKNEIELSSTVIEAKGHTVVIDAAVEPTSSKSGLTEGSHCSVCKEVIVEQKEWKYDYYRIIYDISNGDSYLEQIEASIENENPDTIAKGGQLYLKDISVRGFKFLGWFDASEGGNRIIKITDADHEYKLYAHWQRIGYTIQYKSDLIPVASDVYTSSEGKVLPTPVLDGYTFAGWTDFDGKKYTTIPKGSTGDIILYANWVSDRNQAWANKTVGDPIIYDEDGVILFTYEIGEIKNVPLSVIKDFGKINSNGVTLTETVTTSETVQITEAKKYTKTALQSTTNSGTWTLSKDWTESVSVDEQWCEENGVSVEDAEKYSKSSTNEWYISNSQGGSRSTNVIDSTSQSALCTTTNNTKSWSDDYSQIDYYDEVKETKEKSSKTYGGKVSGSYSYGAEASVGIAKAHADYEVGLEADWHKTKETEDSVQQARTDSTTMVGEAYDDTLSKQEGFVSEHTSSTTNTSTWNTEESYGSSNTVSSESSVTKALTQTISSMKGYGSCYSGTNGEQEQIGSSSTENLTNEYSSTVTYSTAVQEEKTITVSTANTTSGYHRWVYAGTAHVFGVIGYDVASSSYFTYTFSVIDDEIHRFEDYSYNTASYDDNQISVIPFKAPYDIVDYVNARVFITDGVEVDRNGNVTKYNGSDSYVVVPDYVSIDNHDGGKNTVVKITGMKSDAFAGNNDITGIKLSSYIDEIPEGAFEGCSSLWEIDSSATKIGKDAFKGCSLLELWNLSNAITSIGDSAFCSSKTIVVNAANASVVDSISKSGAEEIVIGLSSLDEEEINKLEGMEIVIPEGTKYFALNGYEKAISGLTINSKADFTILNRVNISTNGKIPVTLSSSKVRINQSNISNNGIAIAIDADETEIDLYGVSNISSTSSNALLCKKPTITQKFSGLKSEMKLTGNFVVCDDIAGSSKYSFTDTSKYKVVKVNEETFENMLKSYTLSFDINGGTGEAESKVVANGMEIGNLPEVSKEGFDFVGWYDGTQKVDSSTTYSDGTNHQLVAQYSPKEYTVNWSITKGYTIDVQRSESPNKNASVGKLASGDKVYYGDKLTVTYSALSGYELDSHGGESFTVDRNITSADIYAYVWSDWSDWTTTAATASSNVKVDKKSQYRYSDKQFTESTEASIVGWTKYSSRTEYGSYGNWSEWQEGVVASSDTREVQTSTVYGYYYYLCPYCGAHMHVYTNCFTWAGGCGRYSMTASDWRIKWDPTPWSSCYEFHGTSRYAIDTLSGGRWFAWSPDGSARTGSRYRDRSKTIINSFYKWKSWSAWSDSSYTASSDRQVESRSLYRTRIKY